MEEIVGLKPKMNSIKFDNGKQKWSVKEVSRIAQTSLKHDVYENVLTTNNRIRTNNITIGSNNHQLETICINKIALPAFDDKRFTQENGIQTMLCDHPVFVASQFSEKCKFPIGAKKKW